MAGVWLVGASDSPAGLYVQHAAYAQSSTVSRTSIIHVRSAAGTFDVAPNSLESTSKIPLGNCDVCPPCHGANDSRMVDGANPLDLPRLVTCKELVQFA